jgi:CheY-like chemotaxis protein
MTILIVEDNEMNRDMLARRLRSVGFDIVIADNGLDGVRRAHETLPDLILMDLSLPVVDGWEATRRVKASAVHPAHPRHRAHRARARRGARARVRGRLRRFPNQAHRLRPTPRAHRAPGCTMTMTTSRITLLVVDDEELNRDLLKRVSSGTSTGCSRPRADPRPSASSSASPATSCCSTA